MISKVKMNDSISGRLSLTKLITAFEILMLLALLVVWSVWPLRGTIAARNIALVVGAFAAVAWLIINRRKLILPDLVPIFFLFCVPIWMLGLYLDHPVAPLLQWDELRGTWLRVIIGMVFAFGLGQLYFCRPQYQRYFLVILFIWPVVIGFLFIAQGLFTSSWFGEQIYIYVFKSKVAGVYFLVWSLFFVFAYFHWTLIKNNSMVVPVATSKLVIPKSIKILALVCGANLFLLNSLNALIMVFVDVIALMYFVFMYRFYKRDRRLRLDKAVLIGSCFVCLLAAVAYVDAKHANGKLANSMADVDFILNHDQTGAWRWDGSDKGIYPPINTLTQRPVSGSTYERITWFREGFKFLMARPWGLGYTGNGFAYYMREKYPGSQSTKTHSGWLDFGLGAGVIGVLLIWFAMGTIYVRACRMANGSGQQEIMRLYITWTLSSMLLLWLIAELSDREYIEHFFFMLAFFTGLSSSNKPCFENA